MSANGPDLPESSSTRAKGRVVLRVPPGYDGGTSPQVDDVIVDETLTEPEVNIRPETSGLLSQAYRDRFREARAAGDLQGQLDVLFEALTGERP